MSEEEILKQLEDSCILDNNCYEVDCLYEKDLEAIRDLLDLYNKEKEKNEKLEWKYKKLEHKYKRLRCDYNFTHELQRKEMIHKFQIIRKIKELEKVRETLTDSNGMLQISERIEALKELLEEQ